MATGVIERRTIAVVAAALLLPATAAARDDAAIDFTGTYEFAGPLIAIGPCDERINGRWETRCVAFPYNDAGRGLTIDARHDGSVECARDGLARLNTRTLYDIRIEQGADVITIRYQYGDVVRQIFLDGRTPPADTPHTLHGFSTGRIEGDTLVIETTHLAPAFAAIAGDGRIGAPTGTRARIVERWWPAPTPGNLLMDMVLDDPEYYERPFLMHRREWSRIGDHALEPWDCVDASELLFDDAPDLDEFFGNDDEPE